MKKSTIKYIRNHQKFVNNHCFKNETEVIDITDEIYNYIILRKESPDHEHIKQFVNDYYSKTYKPHGMTNGIMLMRLYNIYNSRYQKLPYAPYTVTNILYDEQDVIDSLDFSISD